MTTIKNKRLMEDYESTLLPDNTNEGNTDEEKDNVFDFAKKIENRYLEMVQTTTKLSNMAIENVKARNEDFRNTILNKRYEILDENLNIIEKRIKKSINETQTTHVQHLKLTKNSYYEQKKELILKIFDMLNLNFIGD